MFWKSILVAWLGSAVSLLGQSAFPFQISLTQGNSTSNIVNGSTINLVSAGPGQSVSASVVVTYLGATSAAFNTAPQVLGAQNFTVVTTDTFPKTLHTSEKLSFSVTYVAFSPLGSVPITAQLSLGYVEAGTPSTAGFMVLGLSGSTPDLSVSYTLPSTGNVTPLISGSTLLFPDTLVNATATVTISVTNRGNGSGSISVISVTGAAFQPLGLPILPINVSPGASFQFLIRYGPKQAQLDTGTLQMTLGGNPFTATLQGNAIASSFSYQVVRSNVPQTILPGQTISFPDTKIAQKSAVDIAVTNTGSAAGTITSIVISGTGFTVTDGPALPVVLNPNDILTITVTFSPQQPGPATGRLRFNNDAFNLTGNGIGPQLVYSYAAGNSSSVTIVAGDAVVFAQQSVGQSSTVSFTVQNTGTASGTVISIGTALPTGSTQSPGVFKVANLPALPSSLDPGKSLTFTVLFSPNNVGLATSNLLVDTAVFALSGIGGAPVPLPAYSFAGPQGAQSPFQQPAVSLSLSAPYSLPVNGMIALRQDAGTLSPDPAVQFATGGQTIPFTIPANSTDAVFSNGSKQVRLQTGSVATTVTLTPSFATQAGLDLTPSSPLALQFTVARAAPQLLSAGITSFASNTFTVTVTGYTTSRSLTGFQFQLTANPTVSLSSSKLLLDVSGASQTWFQSSASQSFGGQFTVAIPFNLQVSSGVQASPIDNLQSISVTASNEIGSSNSITATIP